MYPLSFLSPSLLASAFPSSPLPSPGKPSPGRSNVLGLRLPSDRVTLRRNDGTEVIAIDQTTLMAFLYPLPPFLQPFLPNIFLLSFAFPFFFSIGPRLLTRAFIAGQGSSLMKDTSRFLTLLVIPISPAESEPSIFIREIRRRSPIVDLSQLNFVTRAAHQIDDVALHRLSPIKFHSKGQD